MLSCEWPLLTSASADRARGIGKIAWLQAAAALGIVAFWRGFAALTSGRSASKFQFAKPCEQEMSRMKQRSVSLAGNELSFNLRKRCSIANAVKRTPLRKARLWNRSATRRGPERLYAHHDQRYLRICHQVQISLESFAEKINFTSYWLERPFGNCKGKKSQQTSLWRNRLSMTSVEMANAERKELKIPDKLLDLLNNLPVGVNLMLPLMGWWKIYIKGLLVLTHSLVARLAGKLLARTTLIVTELRSSQFWRKTLPKPDAVARVLMFSSIIISTFAGFQRAPWIGSWVVTLD